MNSTLTPKGDAGRKPEARRRFEQTEIDRRVALSETQDYVSRWREWIVDAFADPDNEGLTPKVFRDRLAETRSQYATLKSKHLRESDFEPSVWGEILNIVVDGLVNADVAADQSLDVFQDLLIRVEMIRRLVRDTLDDHVYEFGRDQQSVVRQLNEWLDETSAVEKARLLGISTKQYGRWAVGVGKPGERLMTVATIVAILRRSWSQKGVLRWFDRPRFELNGSTPLECLDDETCDPHEVIALARYGLSQRGT